MDVAWRGRLKSKDEAKSFAKSRDALNIVGDDFKHRLVDEVEKHEHLWNTTKKEYLDRKQRAESWKEIAKTLKEFTVSPDYCQVAFKNVRDQYNRRYQRSAKSNLPSNSKKWPLFERMRFLDPFIHSKSEIKNKSKKEESETRGGTSSKKSAVAHRELRSSSGKTKGNVKSTDAAAQQPISAAPNPPTSCQEPTVLQAVSTEGMTPSEPAATTSGDRKFGGGSSRFTPASHLDPATSVQAVAVSSCAGLIDTNTYIDSFGIAVAGQIKKLHPKLHTETIFEIQRVLFEQDKKSQTLQTSEPAEMPQFYTLQF